MRRGAIPFPAGRAAKEASSGGDGGSGGGRAGGGVDGGHGPDAGGVDGGGRAGGGVDGGHGRMRAASTAADSWASGRRTAGGAVDGVERAELGAGEAEGGPQPPPGRG
jgi:hypothetical protein